jgi:glycosyltransferase involved in cell wall biosynthesis
MFSTADWSTACWTNKQYTAQQLAKRGAHVLYLESPGLRRPGLNATDLARVASRLQRVWRSAKEVEPRLWVHAPLTLPIGQAHGLVRRVNAAFVRQGIATWMRRHAPGPALVWTYHPYIEGALRGVTVSATVYHCVDDVAAIPGIDGAAFRAAEWRLLQEADVVFATSPRLQEHCAEVAGDRAFYERNVADLDHFGKARAPGAVPDDIAGIALPRLGYIGTLSDYKLDFSLVEACAVARPKWQWIFVGEEPAGQASPFVSRLKTLPNVHMLGHRKYADLPDYLRALDVGIMPNLTTGYMASVFPMKLYEYLAAGLPVVSTPLPALDDLGDLIKRAVTPQEWLDVLELTLTQPQQPVPLLDPRIANYSWEKRLDRMLERLQQVGVI